MYFNSMKNVTVTSFPDTLILADGTKIDFDWAGNSSRIVSAHITLELNFETGKAAMFDSISFSPVVKGCIDVHGTHTKLAPHTKVPTSSKALKKPNHELEGILAKLTDLSYEQADQVYRFLHDSLNHRIYPPITVKSI